MLQNYLAVMAAIDSTVVVVSKTCTFPMSQVSLYEKVDIYDDTGKNVIQKDVPQITLLCGKEIDLTPEQDAEFNPRWNEKVDIGDKLRAFAVAIDKLLLSQNTNEPAQLAPANA